VTTIIIGAGVVGTTLTFELARRGEKVTVLDQAAGPADGMSFANGSLITPSMSDPWAAPGMAKMILKYLGKEDAPFLLRLGALPSMVSWGLAFLWNCNPERWQIWIVRANSCFLPLSGTPLYSPVRAFYPTWARVMVDRFNFGKHWQVHLARDVSLLLVRID
jgi:hypothetical protein